MRAHGHWKEAQAHAGHAVTSAPDAAAAAAALNMRNYHGLCCPRQHRLPEFSVAAAARTVPTVAPASNAMRSVWSPRRTRSFGIALRLAERETGGGRERFASALTFTSGELWRDAREYSTRYMSWY